MWPRRSKASHWPSAETSTEVQVPSEVVKSIERVRPFGLVTSHDVSAGACPASAAGTPAPATARSAAATDRIAIEVPSLKMGSKQEEPAAARPLLTFNRWVGTIPIGRSKSFVERKIAPTSVLT